MSMIRTVSYKASIQADGSIYNESVEYGVDMDSMPLAQSQLDDAGARVDQLRQAILGLRKKWEGITTPDEPEKDLALPPTDPSVLKNAPGVKPAPTAGQATEKQVNYITELAAKTDNRAKLLKAYLAKNNLSDLKHLNQKQVDELIMRLRNEV